MSDMAHEDVHYTGGWLGVVDVLRRAEERYGYLPQPIVCYEYNYADLKTALHAMGLDGVDVEIKPTPPNFPMLLVKSGDN